MRRVWGCAGEKHHLHSAPKDPPVPLRFNEPLQQEDLRVHIVCMSIALHKVHFSARAMETILSAEGEDASLPCPAHHQSGRRPHSLHDNASP
jgi:hypothetical protein